MVKKGDSSFNVVFKDKAYTNKLCAQNITLAKGQNGDVLTVDFAHYFKRKRNNLEDSDYERLVKQQGEISHFVIADDTVAKAVGEAKVVEVKVQLSDTSQVSVRVASFDKESGLLR